MKEYGIVKFFDDYNGIIKGKDGLDYILNYNEINESNDNSLKKGDFVEFVPEQYNTIETNLYIARSVKKISKETKNSLEASQKGIK